MTPREIIAHVLLMGHGSYASPEDWADALLRRLDHEGLQIVRKPPQKALRTPSQQDEQHMTAWRIKQSLR